MLVYYSGEVLHKNTNNSDLSILLFSMGFGIINFVFALPAFYTINRRGRRSLLLLVFPILALCQFLTTIAFIGPDRSDEDGPIIATTKQWWLSVIGMYLFGVFYSFSEGPVPFVYAAESIPLYIRDIGMGLVTSVNWLFNWLIAFTLPKFLTSFRPWGTFLWYSLWCVALWWMIFL